MVGVTPPVQVKVLRNGVHTMEYRVTTQIIEVLGALCITPVMSVRVQTGMI